MFTHTPIGNLHFLPASSNVPTRFGTSSSSASACAFTSRLLSWLFKNWYCLGPTCFRMSGIMSLSSLVSAVPATTNKFSLTENYAKYKSECVFILTYFVVSWDEQRCCHPWTCWPHQYLGEIACLKKDELLNNHLPNFLMVDFSFLSSFTSWWWTTFLVLLWVPINNTQLNRCICDVKSPLSCVIDIRARKYQIKLTLSSNLGSSKSCGELGSSLLNFFLIHVCLYSSPIYLLMNRKIKQTPFNPTLQKS